MIEVDLKPDLSERATGEESEPGEAKKKPVKVSLPASLYNRLEARALARNPQVRPAEMATIFLTKHSYQGIELLKAPDQARAAYIVDESKPSHDLTLNLKPTVFRGLVNFLKEQSAELPKTKIDSKKMNDLVVQLLNWIMNMKDFLDSPEGHLVAKEDYFEVYRNPGIK